MQNPNIVPITEQRVPTIVAFSKKNNSHVIGKEARLTGLQGKTTVFNFKPVLGRGDAEFSKNKKFWCYLAASENQKETITTYTAKEATVNFLKELFRNIDIPEQILIGEPAIREGAWKENFRKHIREIFKDRYDNRKLTRCDNANLTTPMLVFGDQVSAPGRPGADT